MNVIRPFTTARARLFNTFNDEDVWNHEETGIPFNESCSLWSVQFLCYLEKIGDNELVDKWITWFSRRRCLAFITLICLMCAYEQYDAIDPE